MKTKTHPVAINPREANGDPIPHRHDHNGVLHMLVEDFDGTVRHLKVAVYHSGD